MGKLKIKQALKSGIEILIKNPIIFVPTFIMALSSVYMYTTMSLSLKFIITYLLILLANYFLSIMFIKLVYDAKMGKPSLGQAAKFGLRKYTIVFAASIIFYIIYGFGWLALVIPAIFLMIKFGFFMYAILIDNERVINSLKKSWRITRGNWWRLLALQLILATVIWIPLGVSIFLFQDIHPIIYFFVFLFFISWSMSAMTFAYLQLNKEIS